MEIWAIVLALGIPSAITAFCFGMLRRKIDKNEKEQEKRHAIRVQLEVYNSRGIAAALSLGEETAKSIKRRDSECNGEMTAALNFAEKVKNEHRDFLREQGIEHIMND